ncbi:MAG: hypothetical protein ACYCW6_28475 [Candidatus Xenobia bacterium]
MRKPTNLSVTGKPCICGYLERAADNDEIPIVFDARLNEYNYEYSIAAGDCTHKGSLRIYHCPFCGGAAPQSKRALMFTVVQPAEKRRLNKLLEKVHTIQDAIQLLGPPDDDNWSGETVDRSEKDGKAPTSESFRALRYYRLSETATVCITDHNRDRVHVTFQGKYMGLNETS